jgi:hypothetical protein
VAAAKRFRGGPSNDLDDAWIEGTPPIGPLGGDPQGPSWCGHHWSKWTEVAQVVNKVPLNALGLYRIRVRGQARLVYVGEGRISSRVISHLRKVGAGRRQAQAFGQEGLESSWAQSDAWLRHHRLGLETDLIAPHVLTEGAPPSAQFLG